MNSNVSEKPTRARDVVLAGLLGASVDESLTGETSALFGWTASSLLDSERLARDGGSSGRGIVALTPWSKLVGLLGALLPFGVQSTAGG